MHVDILKAGAKTDSYDFYSTTIGKNTFANVIFTNKDNPALPPTGYTFVRYSLSDAGTLKISSLSPQATAAAVQAGKLKGTVTPGKDPEVFLTDSDKDLAKFMKNADLDKLFTNEMTLAKVK